MNKHSMPKVPNNIQDKFTDIIRTIKSFCNDNLNDEYHDLALKLTVKIARKRPSPLLSGRTATWSAGIVHALGMVNFLFDKSQTPYIQSIELAEWFDLSQSTVSAKSKSIRDMLKISQLDSTWTLPSRISDHPMTWLVEINGFIIDIRHAPYEFQVQAFNAGIIPYIPDHKKHL
jgi:hypothetical protein